MSGAADAALTAAFVDWEAKGPETKRTLLELLGPDFSFASRRALDFGCGGGRTLRHLLAEADTGELWGVDIDEAAIEFLAEHHAPPLHVRRVDPDPPLPFPDRHFDVAWAVSVFTHLTGNSLAWLLELHRVLAPGGLLVATYMGRHNCQYLTGEPWDEDRYGMCVLQHTNPWSRGGPNVMISDWWMRAHWGRIFEIGRVLDGVHNMSWAVLRRREVQLTEAELAAPADDPREYAALENNLRLVRRELEFWQQLAERRAPG